MRLRIIPRKQVNSRSNSLSKQLPTISISVVSHGHASLIDDLLKDIESSCGKTSIELILTLNLDETLPFSSASFSFPIKVIYNKTPMGFAANHNQAFIHATGEYFCVLNPDIRLSIDPFPHLIACFKNNSVGVSAPLVMGAGGEIEDSARFFPTPFKILCKFFGGSKGIDYVIQDKTVYPDWVGGMFMFFPFDIFEQLGGFDHRYFLYYEDVDICARLRLMGYEVVLCPQARVTHHAQRSSHRNLNYLLYHLRSMMRFFFSPVFWRLKYREFTHREHV